MNISIRTFISSSQLSAEQHGRDPDVAVELERRATSTVRADDREVDARHTSTNRNVAAGPAAAILNSSAGRARVAAHLGEAAEQEQLDPLDLDPLAAGHERVAELVHDQRPEEQQRA